MKTFFVQILFVFILIQPSNPANAACTLSLSNFNTTVDFTLSSAPGAFSFNVNKKNSNDSCSYFVGFSKGSASSYTSRALLKTGGYTIPFNVRKTSNTSDPALKTYPDTTLNTEVFTGTFSKGFPLSRTYTYYPTSVAWSPSNNLRFGLHSDILQIQLFESTFPPPASPIISPESTANITYQYTVPKMALVSLLDVGTPYTDPAVTTKNLTFSTMASGQSVSFDMVLIYNAGYSIKFNSLNGQRLVNAIANAYFPYTYTVTSVSSAPTLTAGVDTLITNGSGLSPNAPNGDRRTVTFTLQDPVPGAFSGTYTESILITMTSTE
ncbi:MAG: hypothetical protein ACXVCY_14460 [Pseudobdellovibrionaceae bacterium]